MKANNSFRNLFSAQKVVVASMALIFSALAFADDGSSGCGPGWYLLKDNSLVSSSLRFTTNTVLIPVTTIGMTMGTSKCTQHKIVLKEKESLYYTTNSYYELKGEVAKGNGPYLAAYSETIGCEPRAQARFNNALKNNYEKIFKAGRPNPEGSLLEVYKTILNDRDLTNQCSLHLG